MYTTYVFVICYKKEKKLNSQINLFFGRVLRCCLAVFAITALIVAFLPMEYYYDGVYEYDHENNVVYWSQDPDDDDPDDIRKITFIDENKINLDDSYYVRLSDEEYSKFVQYAKTIGIGPQN